MRMLKAKHINLYARYQEKPQNEKKSRSALFIPVLGVSVCLILFLGVLIVSELALQENKKELASLRSAVEDPLLLQEADAAADEMLRAQMAERMQESVSAEMVLLEQDRTLLDGLSDDLLTIAADCGKEIRITNMTWCNGVLEITAEAVRSEAIAPYVRQLEESGTFSAVHYSGYQQSDAVYRFTVRAETKG